MASEKLIVELDAKTEKLDAKLKETSKNLDGVGDKAKKADKAFVGLSKGAAVAAAGVTAASAALVVAIGKAGDFAKELEVAANRASMSVEEMQALAFASNTVGISLEKLGDIFKDTREKIGEFLATGGGGFKDFVDVMNLTTAQADRLASQFSRMGSKEVLQTMVSMMEQANVSSAKMSFALEGMASDTTDLIPLLKNGGEELNNLATEFESAGNVLSATDIQKIKDLSTEYDNLTASLSASGKQLLADFAPLLTDAIEVFSIISTKFSQTISVITAGWSGLVKVGQAALNDFVNGVDTVDKTLDEVVANIKDKTDKLLGNGDENKDAPTQDDIESKLGLGTQEQRDIALENAKAFWNLLGEARGENLADAEEQFRLEVAANHEMLKSKWINEQAFLKANQAAVEKYAKIIKKIEDKKQADFEKTLQTATVLNSAFFEDNKAIAAGIAFVNTAEGVTKALSKYDFVGAALIAATGAAQISQILSATPGGGTVSAPSSGSSQQSQQQSFTPETSTLDLTSQGDEGVNTIRIEFATDSGDDLLDALAGSLNNRARQGR